MDKNLFERGVRRGPDYVRGASAGSQVAASAEPLEKERASIIQTASRGGVAKMLHSGAPCPAMLRHAQCCKSTRIVDINTSIYSYTPILSVLYYSIAKILPESINTPRCIDTYLYCTY